ncbi:MAG: hypothetical protein K8R56_08095, partial [Candidatus Eisenbacteria bacterium]|nr:hypothetical protein [Candidatus Eisenbacteria bacterium]
MHLSRRYHAEQPDAAALRRRLIAELVLLVQDHAPFRLEITPRSIVLDDEPVFEAENSNAPVGERALERELSWVLHRDGIRALRFERGLDEREAGHLLDALLAAAPASATHEDTVTLLWEAGLEHLSLRTEEQSPVRTNPLQQQHAEIAVPHADDWLLPSDAPSDVRRAWAELSGTRAAAMADFRGEWARERAQPFADAIGSCRWWRSGGLPPPARCRRPARRALPRCGTRARRPARVVHRCRCPSPRRRDRP